jgi:hypothetical protein
LSEDYIFYILEKGINIEEYLNNLGKEVENDKIT